MTRVHRSRWAFVAFVGSLVLAPAANAIIGVAPGGSVVRRHAIVATTAVVATESAAASSQAQAQPAPAAPPPAPAAQAPPPAAPAAAGAPVAALPAGCVSETVGTTSYFKCGSTYYQPTFQGSNLVYVPVQAPK